MEKERKIKLKISHNPKEIFVVVLMGGRKEEREISLMSGRLVIDALINKGYKTEALELSCDMNELINIKKLNPDIVFNSLYGKKGEDGVVQGFLEALGLKYTHSGVTASAIAGDKLYSKNIFESHGIKTPKFISTKWDQIVDSHPIKRPYVVKPRDEGSSLGIHLIKEGSPPIGSFLSIWPYNHNIIVEEFISGTELSTYVLGDNVLTPISIHPPEEKLFDYQNKYTINNTKYSIPPKVSDKIVELAKNTAFKVHRILGLGGVSGYDFIYDHKSNELYLLEVNTHPGLTEFSLLPKVAKYHYINYEDICACLIEESLKK
jgi:D-alanine-D-alanine ligase